MQKNIGILGFGIVGKSVLTFLGKHKRAILQHLYGNHVSSYDDVHLNIWDAKPLKEADILFAAQHDAHVIDSTQIDIEEFLQENAYVIVSPGVDLHDFQAYDHKIVCELDFFVPFFKKPTIAITGTLGKTTTTKLLTKLVSSVSYSPSLSTIKKLACPSLKAVEGGNVGTGMLDLIDQQDHLDVGVLELSSFQLERNKHFAPEVAIWTNFYPNHLDRHKIIKEYFEAKLQVLKYQSKDHVAIIAGDLLTDKDTRVMMRQGLKDSASHLCVVSMQMPDKPLLTSIERRDFSVVYVHEESFWITRVANRVMGVSDKLCDVANLPDVTFLENWLVILAALHFLGADMLSLPEALSASCALDDYHHRVEPCATINDVVFYNDSKSTVTQATEAAVKKLAQSSAKNSEKYIFVILGGLSKGVDRSSLMTTLAGIKEVKKIYCFGKDCASFGTCDEWPSLDAVLDDIFSLMQPGDRVLFSPSGASFDLFDNYQHRGKVFKELVLKKAAELHSLK